MTYIVMDLEWNGAWSKRAHGYFNEIIEIGATMLNDRMEKISGFHVLIRPIISRKLTHLVTDLTGIEQGELEDGLTFEAAMHQLTEWIGPGPSVLLTWSHTDLLVLLENYRFFFHRENVPWLHAYLDAQLYCQSRMNSDDHQQIGLGKACELLGISDEGLTAHRAQDDSEMTARVLAALYEEKSLTAAIRPADAEFYRWLTFKPTIVDHLDDPLVKPEYLAFSCPICKRALRPKNGWRFFNQSFFAEMPCRDCGKRFTARVQIKKKYEGIAVRRKIIEKVPKPVEPDKQTIMKEGDKHEQKEPGTQG